MNHDWMRLADEAAVPSPSLLIHPDRVEENLRRMIAITGGPARLRPHIKTHKLPELARLQDKYADQPYQGPQTPRLHWST